MSDGGKGSKPRPYSVDHETFSNNWDAIFNKKKLEQNDEKDINPDDPDEQLGD